MQMMNNTAEEAGARRDSVGEAADDDASPNLSPYGLVPASPQHSQNDASSLRHAHGSPHLSYLGPFIPSSGDREVSSHDATFYSWVQAASAFQDEFGI